MSLEYRIGDVFERMAEIPDGSIDLIVTSPPFLALRSYLPADHPDKHKEIGSEPTPAEFIDTMLALSAEWGRVLAPHGSLCVELGDTYSGSGQGPDQISYAAGAINGGRRNPGPGWPLAKSMSGIPQLYELGLSYGRNLLTGEPSPAGQWRVRNRICWARPNPPVGALGDKFRPATSYITVACKGTKRYFDLDAVRTEYLHPDQNQRNGDRGAPTKGTKGPNMDRGDLGAGNFHSATGGAPPLDWHADDHPEDGDWLWKLSTQPYKGKVKQDRWVPIDRSEAEAAGVHADDIRRTASPDCPRHGGLPGQVPKALRDGHAAARSSHSEHNGSHLDGEQLPGFEPNDATLDREGSSHSPTTVPSDPGRDPAATPHSSSSHRTDPAPVTTQPGTPSARTAVDTEHTSTSRGSFELHLDIDGNRTSLVGSVASPEPQSSDDTPDTESLEPPCTCSFHRHVTEYTSHYATFPMALPKRLIEAMCPQRVCTECGKPSERITERSPEYAAARAIIGDFNTAPGGAVSGSRSTLTKAGGRDITAAENITTGWTDCGHDNNWRTGIVLDPFGGSGTTAEAAQAVGRHAICIDLDERNAELARERVGMFLEVVA